MEKKQESGDSKSHPVGEWYDNEHGEREILTRPTKINDPECKHKWQFVFTDSEGFDNYRCSKCPFGKREKNG